MIVGQEELIDRLLMALLCNEHVLIEGVPGLAKTLSVTTLARMIQASFRRIQFTPDLLPADLIGTLIYNPKTGDFSTKKGPIFANIILADEINRAPAKVQSALLEAMQERQVTIGDETFALDDPFLVLATQNPIEQEGTYPLPEAQVDRFMLKLKVALPEQGGGARDPAADGAARDRTPRSTPVITPEDILRLRELADEIYMDEKIEDYIVDLVEATRNPEAYGLEIERPDPLRGLAAGDDLPGDGGAGQRLPRGARLRDAAGRQDDRAGRAAAPRHPHLRGRGRGEDLGGHHRARSWRTCPCREADEPDVAMIPRELAKKIRYIQIYTSKAVNDVLAGEYHSVFKGRGMEFEEVREYQPGDDVRSIDWNVTARMGEPFVKRFREERELTVMFVVDLSASGDFGSADKLKNEVAAEICALLAFSAIKNNDKVGLIVFTDTVELFVPPAKGTTHVLRLIRDLLRLQAAAGAAPTSRRRSTTSARSRARQAVVFLVSDFLEAGFEKPLRMVGKRHDVIAVSIADPVEVRMPDVGLVELEDAETGELIEIDTGSAAVRQALRGARGRPGREAARVVPRDGHRPDRDPDRPRLRARPGGLFPDPRAAGAVELIATNRNHERRPTKKLDFSLPERQQPAAAEAVAGLRPSCWLSWSCWSAPTCI